MIYFDAPFIIQTPRLYVPFGFDDKYGSTSVLHICPFLDSASACFDVMIQTIRKHLCPEMKNVPLTSHDIRIHTHTRNSNINTIKKLLIPNTWVKTNLIVKFRKGGCRLKWQYLNIESVQTPLLTNIEKQKLHEACEKEQMNR